MYMTWREERNRDEDPDAVYRIFADGTTVVYELQQGRWRAAAWSADPTDPDTCDRAEYLGMVCEGAPRSEMFNRIALWSDPDNRKGLLS